MNEMGDRVGAICSYKEGVLKFFGWGTYLGKEIPEDENVKFMGMPMKEMGLKNPCIELENGDKIYGCECWWGNEKQVQEMISEAKEVEYINIVDYRKLK